MPVRPSSLSTNEYRFLVVVSVAPFLVVLDTNVVTVALPAIRGDVGFSHESLQWVQTAFTLSFGGFLTFCGRAGDAYGRRRLLVLGCGFFAVGSLAAGVAVSGPWLVGARAVQGLGAAMTFPASISIIAAHFDDGVRHTRALAVFGGVLSAGLLCGTTLGAMLVDVLGWRVVMSLNVPIAAIAAVGAARLAPESRGDGSGGALSLRAVLLGTAALFLLLYGLAEGGDAGWLSTPSLAVVAASAFLGMGAIYAQRCSPVAARAGPFRQRAQLGAGAAALLTVATSRGVMFVLTLYLQEILGLGAAETGLALALFGITGVMASAAVSRLAELVGRSATLIVTLLVQALGVLLMLPIEADNGVGWVVAGTAVLGSGHFGSVVLCTALGTAGIPARDQGVAAGLLNSAQQIGATLGLALQVAVASGRTGELTDSSGTASSAAVVEGFRWALATGASLAVVAAAVVWVSARPLRKRA